MAVHPESPRPAVLLLLLLLLAASSCSWGSACSGPPVKAGPGSSSAAGEAAQGSDEATPYVGVLVCRDCHPTAWRAWLGSRHARSVVALHTGMAPGFAARMGMPEMPSYQEVRNCLGCHGVGVQGETVAAGTAGFHPQEGVTCEACHGPGGRHVAAAQRKLARPDLVAGLRASPRDCLECHADKPSHEHERRIPFDSISFSEKIRHGLEPAAAEAGAGEQGKAGPPRAAEQDVQQLAGGK